MSRSGRHQFVAPGDECSSRCGRRVLSRWHGIFPHGPMAPTLGIVDHPIIRARRDDLLRPSRGTLDLNYKEFIRGLDA
jgi:hypothetical protein